VLEKSFGECKKFLLMLYLLIYRKALSSFLMVLKFGRVKEKKENYDPILERQYCKYT